MAVPAHTPELEVHHINVSQGDSTLIINRNLAEVEKKIDASTHKASKPAKVKDWLPFCIKNSISLAGTVRAAMLIDAGDGPYGQDVAAYMKEQGIAKKNPKLFTLVTHYHADHADGMRDVFFDNFDSTKKLNAQTLNFEPVSAFDCGTLKKWDNSGTRTNYKRMVAEVATRGRTVEKVFDINKTYHLEKDADNVLIKLKIIATNGSVSTNATSAQTQVIDPKKSPEQNSRSVVMVLEYGEFRYFLGGDLGGDGGHDGGNFLLNKESKAKKFYNTYPNLEEPVTKVLPKFYPKDPNRAKTLDGHVCVFFANHHGSSSSNDVFLIEQLKPTVVVCSSGVRMGFHAHPTQEFFQRTDPNGGYSPKWQQPGNTSNNNPTIDNTVKGYYITEMAQNGTYGSGKSKKVYNRNYSTDAKILGDIIVRPTSRVTVANPNGNNPITIQVYGTGFGTDAAITTIPLRPFEPGNVSPPSYYRIGPFDHICDKH